MLKLASKEENSKRISIESEIEENLMVDGDEKQLSQLTWNLIKNSKEAVGNEGKICVKLVKDEQKVVLEVEDNGQGIPLDLRERIFEPFYTTKIKGSGLGLAIVQRIVKNHHGQIKVNSPSSLDHEGTQISVFLPIYSTGLQEESAIEA